MKAFALPLLSIQQKVTLSPMQCDHGPQTDLVRQSCDKISIFYVPTTSELCFNFSILLLQQIVSSPSFTPGNMVLVTFRTGITFSVGGIRLSLPSSYQLLSASLDVLNYGRAAESATALTLEGSVVRIAVVNVWHGNNELVWWEIYDFSRALKRPAAFFFGRGRFEVSLKRYRKDE